MQRAPSKDSIIVLSDTCNALRVMTGTSKVAVYITEQLSLPSGF